MFVSEEVRITGGCLCGAIRYEADHHPLVSALCHFRMCQKNFGSAFSTVLGFKSSRFRILSGEPVCYQSSEFVQRNFCGSRASPIAYQRDDTEFVVIQMGTLDHPGKYEPKAQIYTDTKISWVDIQSHLTDKTLEMPSYKVSRGTV
jgi:hypothetical protein